MDKKTWISIRRSRSFTIQRKIPQSPASEKVGIVCHSRMDDDTKEYEVKLYLVDIGPQSCDLVEKYAPAVPVVRFRSPERKSNLALCVLNFTLYIFGGYNTRHRIEPDTPAKSAHKLVLSEEILVQKDYHVKGLEQLSVIRNMHHAKGLPIAIPTPDRTKILVFATYSAFKESSDNFELYDPSLDQWEELPGLPCKPRNRRQEFLEVTSYSFVGKSHFFVVTSMGSFALDLEKKKAWLSINIPWINLEGYFVTAKGRYALTHTGFAYDFETGAFLTEGPGLVHELDSGSRFPLSTFDPPNTPHSLQWLTSPSIVPIEPMVQGEGEGEAEDGEVCNTCILQLETVGDKDETRVLIDVCETDLLSLATKVRKSVSLLIDYLDIPKAITLISV